MKASDHHFIHELPTGKYRNSNKDEIDVALVAYQERMNDQNQISILKLKLKTAKDTCKHLVCYDEPGYIYHSRRCITCGHSSLV